MLKHFFLLNRLILICIISQKHDPQIVKAQIFASKSFKNFSSSSVLSSQKDLRIRCTKQFWNYSAIVPKYCTKLFVHLAVRNTKREISFDKDNILVSGRNFRITAPCTGTTLLFLWEFLILSHRAEMWGSKKGWFRGKKYFFMSSQLLEGSNTFSTYSHSFSFL